MKEYTFSIKTVLASAFAIVILFISLLSYLQLMPKEKSEVEEQALEELRKTAYLLSAEIQNVLLKEGTEAAANKFKAFAKYHDVPHAVLVDAQDRVISGNDAEWIGKDIKDIAGHHFELGRGTLLRAVLTPFLLSANNEVGIVGPLAFPIEGAGDDQLSRQGFFIIEKSYEATLEQATSRLIYLTSVIVAMILFLAIVILFVVDDQFVKRSKLLTDTVSLMLAGNWTARTHITGRDELGKMGAVIDRLGERFKTSTEEAKLKSNTFETIMNSSADGLVAVDDRGSVRFVNDSVVKILGYEKFDLVGKSADAILSDAENIAFGSMLRRARAAASQPLDGSFRETHCIHNNGSHIPVNLRYQIYEIDGKKTIVISFHDISGQKEKLAALNKLAYYDILTGLPNANALEMFIKNAMDGDDEINFLFLEIEIAHFGAINSTFGYDAGDKLLQSVARRLSLAEFQTEIVSRIEGDRFAVVFALTEDEKSREIVERVKERVSRPVNIDDIVLRPQYRFGVLLAPEHTSDPDHVLMYLNRALKRAKDNSRTNIGVFSRGFIDETREYTLMTQELADALKANALELYMQPQVDLTTRKIIGAEGLVRWTKANGESVSPVDFIPVAEKSGLIVDLGKFVMHEVLKFNRDWHRAGGHPIVTAINLSAEQFNQADLVTEVMEAMIAYGIDANTVELELTETAVMSDPASAFEKMEHLRMLGVDLAIDDFGTGYSSLQYLRDLPVSKLKIDRSFVNGLSHQPEQASIVQMILMLAQRLGMETIAEGIEKEEDAQFLSDNGCPAGQGYLFHRPMPVKEFMALANGQDVKQGSKPRIVSSQ